MKKLILMLLVLAGGVSILNAKTVTRRIFIQNSGLWASPTLYMYQTDDESSKPLGTWPGKNMTGYNNGYDNWYFVDASIDDSKAYSLILNNNNGGTQSANMSLGAGENKFYSVWGTSDSDYNINNLTYFLYNTSDGSTTEMELGDNLELSITIDNTTGASNYYVVAPSFVTAWYPTDSKRWDLMIRPYSDYAALEFSNISADREFAKVLVETNNSNSWNTNGLAANITLKVQLADGTYSVSPYFTRDLGSAGYATFSSAYNVAIPDGVKAYYATSLNDGKTKINMTKLSNGIAANEGAFLQGTGKKTFTPATSTDDATDNMLKPTDGNNIYDSEKNRYVFANQGGDLAFYQVKSSLSPAAGKAYLETSETLAAGARLSFVFDDEEVSGINTVKATTAGAEGYYNLAGQRVASPTKGLYIVNGKKVIIK